MKTDNRILVVVDPTASNNQVCVDRGAWLAKQLDTGLELLICHYEQFLTGTHVGHATFLDTSRQFSIEQQKKKLEAIAGPLREEGLDVIVSAVWDRPLADGIIRHVLRTAPKIVVKETHYHNVLKRAVFTNNDWYLTRKCPVPVWFCKSHDWPYNGRIIASVDPAHTSEKDSSLDRMILDEATLLADKLSGELHVFHSYMPIVSGRQIPEAPSREPIDKLDKQIETKHESLLGDLIKDYPVSQSQTHLEAGDPVDLLPSLATELSAGLVVMGAIARSLFQRIMLGSTTEKVLDLLPCDLLVMKPDWFRTSVGLTNALYYEGTRDQLPTKSAFQTYDADHKIEKAG